MRLGASGFLAAFPLENASPGMVVNAPVCLDEPHDALLVELIELVNADQAVRAILLSMPGRAPG